jgi:hypothetical protein
LEGSGNGEAATGTALSFQHSFGLFQVSLSDYYLVLAWHRLTPSDCACVPNVGLDAHGVEVADD